MLPQWFRASRGLAAGTLVVAALALSGCGRSAGPQQLPEDAGSPPPTPTATAPPLSHSLPERIDIEKIGVDAPVKTLGLNSDGTLETPPLSEPNLAGWYKNGPTPGELGPAVISGHVDSAKSGPAVFYKLGQLRPGDGVKVTRQDGSRAVFAVDRVERVPKDAFPTTKVYGNIGFPGLRLITCGGGFDRRSGHYVDNIIAYAHLAAAAKS